MKYAYPQNPSSAVSAIRRFDETSDALTQQSDLDRKQGVALIGETVPMVFCSRSDFGNDQGRNGGVWISPKLVQLGLEGERLSMMYLLSQGKLTGIAPGNVYWGQEKLLAQDSSASFCTGYEEVPPCLDLDYEPGGELGFGGTLVKPGPDGTGSFITEDNCIKINIAWESRIEVRGSAQIVSGFTGKLNLGETIRYNPASCTVYDRDAQPGSISWYASYGRWPRGDAEKNALNNLHYNLRRSATRVTNEDIITYTGCKVPNATTEWDFGAKHYSASWTQTSEVRFNWTLTRVSDDTVVRNGQVWVRHNTSSLTIDGLEADKYRLTINNRYAERNRNVTTSVIPTPSTYSQFASYWQQNWGGNPPQSGFSRYTYSGNETEDISSIISQELYTELILPDLPGGQQQIVGGLRDLTMGGIEGNILSLRPLGIDRFLQAHVFVEQGIRVTRLLDGRVGSSRLYADLVNYLMSTTKILQQDQIDTAALRLSAQMNQAYSLFFNGILQTTNSLSEWMTRTAPYFLLSPRQVDGKYGLAPVCPLDSNSKFKTTRIIPSFVITADQIIEGSYSRNYLSNKERRPVCLVMVYRDQPTQQIGQTVTIEARYPGTAETGPYEQHDLTEFCCRAEHAIYAARYILAKRRYTTHTCQVTIGRKGRTVKPGDIVQINLDFDTNDGKGIEDQTLYQVEAINEGQEGTVDLELTHFPVNSNGVSLVASSIETGAIVIT